MTTLIIQFLVAMVAVISFAIIFNAPWRELLNCGLTGALGWIIYFILIGFDLGFVFSSLVATFCLTILSRILAVKRKKPFTVYLLTGIFPLVPGAGIYYTAYYFFTNNRDMFAVEGSETLEVAIAIVFGIILGSAIPQKWFGKGGPTVKQRHIYN